MLAKIIQFVKEHQSDIILLIGVVLISLLSFAIGYIAAKDHEKEPIRIEFRIQNLESRIVGEEDFALFFTFASIVEREFHSFSYLHSLRELGNRGSV